MKKLIILFVTCIYTIVCKSQNTANFITIAVSEFAIKLKEFPTAQLVDVRTPGEFAAEHIDNAQNINWNSDDFDAKIQKLDKNQPVYVYCKMGGRSAKASQKMSELGFTKIYNLDGGFLKWSSAGFERPIDKIIGICPQEYTELINSHKKILVNFYADWCEPCQKMKPYLIKMQANLNSKINIVRLSADENKTIMKELKIDELPVLILYANDKIVWRKSGFISEDDLKKYME